MHISLKRILAEMDRRPGAVALSSVGMVLVAATLFVASFGGRATTAQAAPPEPCSTSVPGWSSHALVSHDPSASVTPNKGPVGTAAVIHVWNFLPNQNVTAIFRVTGDPVVASGTVDANGEAYLNFTVPSGPDGVYWILVAQENRTCVHASVHFEIGQVPPTATPSPRPTATPVPPTAAPPTPTPQPKPPVAGLNANDGDGLADFRIAAGGFLLMAAGFSALSFGRWFRQSSRS